MTFVTYQYSMQFVNYKNSFFSTKYLPTHANLPTQSPFRQNVFRFLFSNGKNAFFTHEVLVLIALSINEGSDEFPQLRRLAAQNMDICEDLYHTSAWALEPHV